MIIFGGSVLAATSIILLNPKTQRTKNKVQKYRADTKEEDTKKKGQIHYTST